MKKILLVAFVAICLQLSFIKCQSKPIIDSNRNKSVFDVYDDSNQLMVVSWKCHDKIYRNHRLREIDLNCMFFKCYNKSNCDDCRNFPLQKWMTCVREEDVKYQKEKEKKIKKEEQKKIESKYLTLTPDQQYIAYRCFDLNGEKEDLQMLQKMCIFNNCYNSGLFQQISQEDCVLKCLEQNQNNPPFLDYLGNWMKCVSRNERKKYSVDQQVSRNCAGNIKSDNCGFRKTPECDTFQWDCLTNCRSLSLDECNKKYTCEITNRVIFDRYSECFTGTQAFIFE